VQPQPIRTTLIFSTLATAIWVGISFVWGDWTVREAAIGAPLFFGIIFFTMRLTNRLTTGIVGRWGPKPQERQAPPPPAEPSSSRPEHAERRRSRRRRRRRAR
jgi:hypothetical protein